MKSAFFIEILFCPHFPDALRDGDDHENGGDELCHRKGQPDAGHAKEGGEKQRTEADGHKAPEDGSDEGPGGALRGA